MSGAYYNECDEEAADWLERLIAAGEIAPGVVDRRDIRDVRPSDLFGFTQCHFFAGIGGWSLAARLAGWPDDRPIWTGSCPCQPFASPGRKRGFADERHLWPHWFHLVGVCRPGAVAGEQVATGDGLAWLDLVQDDMEAQGYAFAALDLSGPVVGAPHIRQRLYFGAHDRGATLLGLDHGDDTGPQGLPRHGDGAPRWAQPHRPTAPAGASSSVDGRDRTRPGPANGFWGDADWLLCRDDSWRPVEPGTFPLADGIPARVGRLRGYGNAVVPPLAAAFLAAFSASLRENHGAATRASRGLRRTHLTEVPEDLLDLI